MRQTSRKLRSRIVAGIGTILASFAVAASPAQAALSPVPDLAFPQTNNSGSVQTIAISGNTAYVGGIFSSFGGQPRNNAAAFDLTTGAVTEWNPQPDGAVNEIVVSPSGASVYLAGQFTTVGGLGRKGLARASATGIGGVHAAWDPTSTFPGAVTVNAVALAGPTVYFGGDFTTPSATNDLASASVSGGTLGAWSPTVAGVPGGIVAELLMFGGNVYVAGRFDSVNGTSRRGLAKVTTSGAGSVDASWDPNPNPGSVVRALAADPGNPGGFYLGGKFTQIGGVPRNNLARVDPNGTGPLDQAWNPDANDVVRSLALFNGSLFVGGEFTVIGNALRGRVARLGSPGLPLPWNPGADAPVNALVPMTSSVIVGGVFTSFGSGNMAALSRGLGFFRDVPPPVNTELPKIEGDPKVKETLACTPGSWSPAAPLGHAYEWLRDGEPIGQVQSSSYTVTSDDAGTQLACRVTATNLAGSASATSASVAPSALGSAGECDRELRVRAHLASRKLAQFLRHRKLKVKVGSNCPGTARIRIYTTGMQGFRLTSDEVSFDGAGSRQLTVQARTAVVSRLQAMVRAHEMTRIELRLVVTGDAVGGGDKATYRRHEVLRRST